MRGDTYSNISIGINDLRVIDDRDAASFSN